MPHLNYKRNSIARVQKHYRTKHAAQYVITLEYNRIISQTGKINSKEHNMVTYPSCLTLWEFLEAAVERQQSRRHRTILGVGPPCYAELVQGDWSLQVLSYQRMGMYTWQGEQAHSITGIARRYLTLNEKDGKGFFCRKLTWESS